MKLAFASNYESDNKKKYPFPSDAIPQKNKGDKKYFLQAAQAIVTRYVTNQCEFGYSNFGERESIETRRQYALGQQGSNRYKNYLIGNIQQETGCRPQSTINIDWRVIDILPKKLGDVKGYMQKLKYDIVTTAIDPLAIYSKDQVKAAAKLAANDMMRLLHEEINEKAGGMAVDPEGQLVGQAAGAVPFQNADQVESFAAIGGIQLSQEIAMKILIDKTQSDSMAEVLTDLIIDDVLQIGAWGKKYYCEPGSDNVLWDQVEMETAIVPFSKYPNYKDASYFGRWRRITIGELRRTSNLEEEDIIKIATKFNTADYNAQYKLDNIIYQVSESRDQGLGIAVLDSIMVDVAEVEWLGTKGTTQTKVTRAKEGNVALNTVDDNYELSERDKKAGKEVKEYTTQVVYECKMVIGTDFIFDYGVVKNMPYKKNHKGKMCPVMRYSFYKIPGPSITEKCMGFVDDACMALFKKRIILKNLTTGPNIRIDKSAFDNVTIDGKLQNPASLMALFRDEGFLITDSKSPWGNNANSSRPLDVIPSDVIQRLMACNEEIDKNIQHIEIVTGVNSVFSAQSPSRENGLGVNEIAINATENSIFPLIKAMKDCDKRGYDINAHMWKVVAAYMPDDRRGDFASDRSLQYFKIDKQIAWYQYGIKLEDGVTENEKLSLMNEVSQLSDYRRQAGTGGITASDKLTIFKIIKSGNIDLARLTLANMEEYRRQQDEETAQRRSQENAKAQQESNAQATENKQAEIQAEGQVQTNIEIAKIQAQIQLEEIKARNARHLAAQNNIYGWGAETYKKTVKQ